MHSDAPGIWTVGHSNHAIEPFLSLLSDNEIQFLVDVRSFPYSRFAPHFNRKALEPVLEAIGVRYLFAGQELGGRPSRAEHYDADGHALYGEMALEPGFQRMVDRLVDGAREHRIALMCSEGQPRECHRRLLVGKVLAERGIELHHILPDGEVCQERVVGLDSHAGQASLLGQDGAPWRSTRPVSHRRRLSASSAG